MGCEQSTPVSPPQDKSASSTKTSSHHRKTTGGTERLLSRKQKPSALPQELIPPKLTRAGQLMPEEIVKRTTSSHENTFVKVGKPEKGNVVRIQYAYWTQQGWYPDGKRLCVVYVLVYFAWLSLTVSHTFGATSSTQGKSRCLLYNT